MSDSSDSEEHGNEEQQQVTGANADPQLLQYFWDLASLEQVRLLRQSGKTAPSC